MGAVFLFLHYLDQFGPMLFHRKHINLQFEKTYTYDFGENGPSGTKNN